MYPHRSVVVPAVLPYSDELPPVCPATRRTPTPDRRPGGTNAGPSVGVGLRTVKNYRGDGLNVEMAAELAEAEAGGKVETVVTNDDVAVEDSTWTAGRRGVGFAGAATLPGRVWGPREGPPPGQPAGYDLGCAAAGLHHNELRFRRRSACPEEGKDQPVRREGRGGIPKAPGNSPRQLFLVQRDVPQLAHVGISVEIRSGYRHNSTAAVRVDGWRGDRIEQREVFWLHPREPNVRLSSRRTPGRNAAAVAAGARSPP